MLKIYLDWNCINNIEKRHSDLYRLILEYGNLFIFPYSNAHIRDLMMGQGTANAFFKRDIETLTKICGKHLLSFEHNQMMPIFGLPQDYINEVGEPIRLIQNLELITPELYQAMKENTRSQIPEDVYKRIQGASPKEAFREINKYVATQMPGASIQSLTMGEGNALRELMNIEAQFKSVCLALEAFGYRPENKNKKFNNVDTDATHIFYAAHCDYLVSADKSMRARAEAMYREYGYQTEAITPDDLAKLITEETKREYSLDNLRDSIKLYGTPREEADGAHYRLMRTPVFGLFNACMLVDSHLGNYDTPPHSALFTYCFNNSPYLFYTELEHFFGLIKSFLPEEKQHIFQTCYVDEICSRNRERAMKARFHIDCPDQHLYFAFYADPLTLVPCPMMQVAFEDGKH